MDMKKIMIVIFIVIFFVSPVYARAGGGGSGGSSGGGGGSSPSSHGHHTSEKSSYLGRMGSLGGLCLVCGGIFYLRHRKASALHKKMKPELKAAKENDSFWNENDLLKKVEEIYFIVQRAWSSQDTQTLKQYLTDDLYEQWSVKIEWQKYKHEQNLLDHIRLNVAMVVDIHDDIDDSKDYFWVYIIGRMDDQTVVDENVVSRQDDAFVEYWKFQRDGQNIKLADVKQEDEMDI